MPGGWFFLDAKLNFAENLLRRTDDDALHACADRMSWFRLLKRVFDIDVEHCPHRGGTVKIIAAIEEPSVIAKILAHLGLPTRAPPRSPARSFDLFVTARFYTDTLSMANCYFFH